MIFSIKPQIFELKCVFSYFRLKTHITLLLPVYVHSWEQRKLGEIAPLRGGFAFSSNEYCDGGIPIVRISNILSNGSVGGEFVYFKEQENYDLYSLVTGDILLAMSGATTGKVAMIKTEKPYKYYQNQRVGHFTKAKETDYLFVATIVSSDRFTEQLRNVLVAGAQPNVSSKDIDSFEFYVPKAKDEQREIGLYFNHLENLITLHQCKCQIDGCRFQSPLAITWEQRKLGDVVDVRSGKDYKHLSEGNIPVYGTGGFMLNVNQALSYDEDAIGIGRKGTIDKPYILKAPFWTVDTLFYAIPREKVDLNFAFDVFQNIDWKKKDESTGVPSLSKTAINEIDVLVPQYDEQQPLGQFFNRIDNLITLHQCE